MLVLALVTVKVGETLVLLFRSYVIHFFFGNFIFYFLNLNSRGMCRVFIKKIALEKIVTLGSCGKMSGEN